MGKKKSPPCYEIRDVPGKGVGLFATRDIDVGQLILAENPLFTASSPTSIVEAVDRLSDEDRAGFFALRDNHRPDAPSPVTIFKTNVFSLGAGSSLEGGIFPIASRINHSCLPNVHHNWNPTLGKGTIRAISPIGSAQEILTTYIGRQASRAERQAHLRSRLRFECTCKICVGADDPESNIRRTRIAELDDTIATVMLDNPIQGHSLTKERFRLLDSEGLADQSEKGRTNYDAFQACISGLDTVSARRHAGLAYGGAVVGEGLDAENVTLYGDYYRDPRRHPAAGMGRKRTMPMICDTCGCVSKIVCEGCSCAVYCDTVCQKEHAEWHKPICRVIQQFDKKEVGDQ